MNKLRLGYGAQHNHSLNLTGGWWGKPVGVRVLPSAGCKLGPTWARWMIRNKTSGSTVWGPVRNLLQMGCHTGLEPLRVPPSPPKNYAGFAFDNGDRLYSFCLVDTPKQAKRQKIDGMKILIKTKD